MKTLITLLAILVVACPMYATEYHVAINGDDKNPGTQSEPFRSIQHAADIAQPGDTITVHEGTYRERIAPPRGGDSNDTRITYQAAPGEKVMIKGSEVVKGWEKVQNDTWKVVLPNSFFGDYNPYNDLIHGDWFNPMKQEHHTGAVYLNEHWLREAATLDDVLQPAGTVPLQQSDDYLLNVAWLQIGNFKKIGAVDYTKKNGTQNAACSEGGECIGFISHSHWVQYENVDFGVDTKEMKLRVASATQGGMIELRLDNPNGTLIGTCKVLNTGGWQSWSTVGVKITPQSGVKTLCLVFKSIVPPEQEDVLLWYGQVNEDATTLWAQFKGVDPNEALVEITARPAVFYPDKPFINYITVRGFHLWHAGPQWAPPTAEQVGLIGTHWSKGWNIENNDIRYSICTGITLGKHGDEYNNTSADTAEGYVKTIERALAMKWNKETIGHHIVRNNTIAYCEQSGIVGSMGAAFSTVTGNTIYDINMRKLFGGAEMAGIKFHAAIDTVIKNNHIYRCIQGIWLDWMAQGARVSANLLHDNTWQDIFMEVNHGPFLIDNNILLSPKSLLSVSRGGAYVHNLFAGNVHLLGYDARMTPFHKAHSTELAGMHDNPRGDDRYYNNLFIGTRGINEYDDSKFPNFMDGNVFVDHARPAKCENNPLCDRRFEPELKLIAKEDGVYLEGNFVTDWAKNHEHKLVTTELLGKTKVSGLPYENRDGSPLQVDKDYFGYPRNRKDPFPGPFEIAQDGKQLYKVWPIAVQ